VADAVAQHTAGSPVDESIQWTNRSPRDIADEIAEDGFSVSPETVERILREDLGLGLRQAMKDEATRKFPDRDAQFRHIGALRKRYLRMGCPILSIDTKQKELLGDFFRRGRAFTNGYVHVLDHDFATHGTGRMVPYGVFDVARNEGFMMLSVGPDTSELACDTVWRWWQRMGWRHYAGAKKLLLLCDCGGSNGYRQYMFKEELHSLAEDLGLSIRVAHYPPGCSKYNPIERRMFCHVTRALQGVVIKSLDVAKHFIGQTSTRTGLRVLTEKARRVYTKGRKGCKELVADLPIRFHNLLPALNYTAYPEPL